MLVMVPTMLIVTFVPQQASSAVGLSNDHESPHSTTLLVAQVMTGGVVSTTVTVWLQLPTTVPKQLVICHAAVYTFLQGLDSLVTTPMRVGGRGVGQHVLGRTAGGLKLQLEPHSTV